MKIINTKYSFFAGLVNYCVSSGEAHLKAFEIARDIIQKVIYSSKILFYFAFV